MAKRKRKKKSLPLANISTRNISKRKARPPSAAAAERRNRKQEKMKKRVNGIDNRKNKNGKKWENQALRLLLCQQDNVLLSMLKY